MARAARRRAFEASIAGDVPLGAGLSSSASLQASVAWFLIQLGLVPGRSSHDLHGDHSDLTPHGAGPGAADGRKMSSSGSARVCSTSFRASSAVPTMPSSSIAIRLIHDRLPLGKPAPAIVVCDSKTSRRLADGMYDQRRAECERVAAAFRDKIPHRGEFQLSWLSLEQLEAEWEHLDPIGRKRARHVLSENERVRQGLEALKCNDVAAFGRLMSASHASSRDDFENSSPALDALIEAAETAPGFLGGKLSGAGWAGCTVNLVRAEHAGDFAEAVRTALCPKDRHHPRNSRLPGRRRCIRPSISCRPAPESV